MMRTGLIRQTEYTDFLKRLLYTDIMNGFFLFIIYSNRNLAEWGSDPQIQWKPVDFMDRINFNLRYRPENTSQAV